MKKVVVVIDEDKKELIQGENLEVYDQAGLDGSIAGMQTKPTLTIQDNDKIVAQFQVWMYWREAQVWMYW